MINDDGEKIAGAVLCVSVYQLNSSRTSCGPARSDKDGNFELDHVAMGDVRVFCDRKLDAGTTIHSACQEPER